MGRTPKPAPLKLLNGRGPGKDSAGRPVVNPPHVRKSPEAPSWLSAEAKAEWTRVTAELTRLDILKVVDGAVLAAYAETWATFVALTREVRRRGRIRDTTTRGSDGSKTTKRMETAESKLLRETRADLLKFAREFGLTPSSEAAAFQATRPPEDGGGDTTPNPFDTPATG